MFRWSIEKKRSSAFLFRLEEKGFGVSERFYFSHGIHY